MWQFRRSIDRQSNRNIASLKRSPTVGEKSCNKMHFHTNNKNNNNNNNRKTANKWRLDRPNILPSLLLLLLHLLLPSATNCNQEPFTLSGNNNNNRSTRSASTRPTDVIDYSSSRLLSTPNKGIDKDGEEEMKQRRVSAGGPEYFASLGLPSGDALHPQQFYGKADLKSSLGLSTADADSDLASLNLINGERQNICNGHCVCISAGFTNISCDYEQNRKLSEVFNSDFQVPANTLSINIKLAAKTQFRLMSDFFNRNRVNSLIIQGSSRGGEQVEIASEAFKGNNAGYPEVQVLNVFSVIVRSRAFAKPTKFDGKFTVRNCNDLILCSDAFKNMNLNGLFVNINDLRIDEKAFSTATAKLVIESSNIDNLYRFDASLHEVRFNNCTIGNINGGTFDVNNIKTIVFENSRIDVIKAKAITEKFFSDHVSITNAVIGSIESEAIAGSGISQLILKNNSIDMIDSNAIHVTAVNTTIAHNNIRYLGINWLHIQHWSKINVEKNQFGTFGPMMIDPTNQPIQCSFSGNSITKALAGSLNITNRLCRLHEISVNKPCSCDTSWIKALTDRDLGSEIYCTVEDKKLQKCFNSNMVNSQKFQNEACDTKKTDVACVTDYNLKKVNDKFFTPQELEGKVLEFPSNLEIIVIICSIVLAIVLITIMSVVAVRRCQNMNFFRSTSGNGDGGIGDSRKCHLHEFSSQDRIVIKESLVFIEQTCSKKIYKQVNRRVKQLLQPDLPVAKCVMVISKLVDLLNQVPTSADSAVVQFNHILTQHIQPQTPSSPPVNDPIYTEPRTTTTAAMGVDNGFYTSSSIVPLPLPPHVICNGGEQTNLTEHIYAEPNCAEQPLLRTDYASPADRTGGTYMYAEPITHERDHPLHLNYALGSAVAPYAVSAGEHPLLQRQQQHSPQRGMPSNLPDVLNNNRGNPVPTVHVPAAPMVNVRQLAQNLQAKPEFHPSQQLQPSTFQRPRHLPLSTTHPPPVYTAPDLSRKHTHPRRPEAADEREAEARLALPETVDDLDYLDDMRGAAALPPSSSTSPANNDGSSNHSGGSNETVKIDDIIQYADM